MCRLVALRTRRTAALGGLIILGLVLLANASPTYASVPLAEDVARTAGIDFVHAAFHGRDGSFQELTSGGACWGDYDNDGWMDVYLVDTVDAQGGGMSRLYRNLGVDDGIPRFDDATTLEGVGLVGMGQGCTWADYDNDGDQDLFVAFAVTDYAPQGNVLFENLGLHGSTGTHRGFADVTERAGITGDTMDPEDDLACRATVRLDDGSHRSLCFSVAGAWLDHDLDGDLDLYIINYVDTPMSACMDRGQPDPEICQGQANRFWVNNGDGTFTERGATIGGVTNDEQTWGRSLGVVAADLDLDGWTDLYVANDYDANALYRNQGGRLMDVAATTGTRATGSNFLDKEHRSGMGVAAQDLNADGLVDLLSTHLRGQHDAILLQDPHVFSFTEALSDLAALEHIARGESRWGGGFFDLDMDGDRDYLVVTGQAQGAAPGPIHLLLQDDGGFEPADAAVWPFGPGNATATRSYRAAAFADMDNDGDLDLLATSLPARIVALGSGNAGTTGEDGGGPNVDAGRPRLLRFNANHGAALDEAAQLGGHWLRVTLQGTDNNRDAIGAHVVLETVDEEGATNARSAWRNSGGSYVSGHDPRILFALGDAKAGTLTVRWPGKSDAPQQAGFHLGTEQGLDLVVVEDNTQPPSPVGDVSFTTEGSGDAIVAWRPTMATDQSHYLIQFGRGTDPGEVLADERVDGRGASSLVVDKAVAGMEWVQVLVVDTAGHRSAGPERVWLDGEAESPALGPVGFLVLVIVTSAAAHAQRMRRR